MAHEPEDDFNVEEQEVDFESFLKEKEKQWNKPAPELTTTDLTPVEKLDEIYEIRPAEDVVESSSPEQKSTETTENVPPTTSPSASDVVSGNGDPTNVEIPSLERRTQLTLHSHPHIGTYVSEENIAWQLDEKSREIFQKLLLVSVTNLTSEQIIERFHKMEQAMSRIRMAQQGLRAGLAEKLKDASDAERARVHELDREEAKKHQTRRKIERTRKKMEAASGQSSVAPRKAAKTPLQKRVDFFKNNGYEKDYTIEQFKTMGKLDAAILTYIEKVFA